MRSKGLWIAFWAIIPITVAIIAFVSGAFLLPNFIPGIVGIILAYLLLVMSQFATKQPNRGFFGLSIVATATVLFIVSTVFNITLIWVKWPLWAFTIIINLILVAVYLLMVIPMMLSNNQAKTLIEKHATQVQAQHDLRGQVRSLKLATNDPEIVQTIERLEELVRYMPTESSSMSAPYDQAIASWLQLLPALLRSGDKAAAVDALAKVSHAVTERTQALKTGR